MSGPGPPSWGRSASRPQRLWWAQQRKPGSSPLMWLRIQPNSVLRPWRAFPCRPQQPPSPCAFCCTPAPRRLDPLPWAPLACSGSCSRDEVWKILGPTFSLKGPNSEGIRWLNVECRRSLVIPHDFSTSRWCERDTRSVETVLCLRPLPRVLPSAAPPLLRLHRRSTVTVRPARSGGRVFCFHIPSRPRNAHLCVLLLVQRARRGLEMELRPPPS